MARNRVGGRGRGATGPIHSAPPEEARLRDRTARRFAFRPTVQVALLLVVAPLAVACRPAAEAPKIETKVADHGDGIPWFGGTVEEALAKAKAERRPVFLYWGAVWCPPCQVLRTRLFPRPEFRARLAATVPVYLDGDTERAQIWGEKLHTLGYPTVVLLDPDGREITRINSLISIDQYVETLKAALDATRPVPELVKQVESDGVAALSPADRNLLAFYSWYQDDATGLDLAGRRALFDRLWRETPDAQRIEKARFLMLWLQEAAKSEEDTPPLDLPAEERARRAEAVRVVLADRELRNTNLDVVLYGAGAAGWLAPVAGAERAALVAAWNDATVAVERDEQLTPGERVAALYGALQLARLDLPATPAGEEPPPPGDDLQQRIRARVRWAADTVTGDEELQGVMNTMGGVLERAGMLDDVRALLAEKGSHTVAPYYYVSWQADLEETAGHAAEAVKLYREAWQGARATGSADGMTPLRWGSTYLRSVLRLTPEASETVATDGATILGDALGTPDAFAGGNWSRLQAIDQALAGWSKDQPARAAVVESLRARIRDACPAFAADGDDSPGARCKSLVGAVAAG